jgi:hypothetical protein
MTALMFDGDLGPRTLGAQPRGGDTQNPLRTRSRQRSRPLPGQGYRHLLRADGFPNRPLTSTHWEVEALEEPETRIQ